MGAGEIGLFKAPRLHQGHSNGIAKNKRVQGRGRRRQVQRAGLAINRDIKGDLGGLRQAAACRRRHRDDPRIEPLKGGEDPDNFLGLARIRNQDHHIAAPHHAKIAMNGLGRMQEQRWCAGRCQRRRDLAADQPGFSHAADNDMTAGLDHQFDGRREGRV